jgi:hypothetical protein
VDEHPGDEIGAIGIRIGRRVRSPEAQGVSVQKSTVSNHAEAALTRRSWVSKAGTSETTMLYSVSLSMPRYPWIKRLRVAITRRQGT